MTKDKKQKEDAIEPVLKKHVFVRDFDVFVSVNPNVMVTFKKGDETEDRKIIARLEKLLPCVIKAVE